jgi:hypothetical protein
MKFKCVIHNKRHKRKERGGGSKGMKPAKLMPRREGQLLCTTSSADPSQEHLHGV